jgi:WD40 repeat protein/class 3 adenylate cyclase/energy-coupling factor transporter ATP-binding protein EcfA2
MAAVEAGIKTFLIADVRGYTRFTQERGDEAAARLATRFAELAREAIEAAGGTLVELRGDEALAVFDSARQALRAASDLQERFVGETVADPSLPLAVGIGLDAGEAVPVDGGYRGGALNLAARLCSLAGPGEVLVSPGVAHLARKVEGLEYVERGPVRLKGLEKPVEVVAVRSEREDVARDLAFRRALDPGATGALETRNPYKGLRAFTEQDAGDYFGREALTEHLVVRLEQTRFLAVVGPSGSGKSSVVRAGLVPRLRQGALPGSERWSVVEMLPGAYPLEELEAALLRAADSPSAGVLEQLEQDDRGLLRAVKRLLADDESELVLVVDQLEEVFTLVEDEARRAHFLALIERAVADPHARLRVVVTLRADFYDRPLLYSGFAELLRDFVEALVPLKAEEFERAIAGPAERVGARFEPGLLAELVTDVADEPGALPLLQYALTELYERREGSTLTQDAYRAIGGLSGALAGRAEEIYAGLGDLAQEAARQLFLRLVTLGEGSEDTRRRVDRTELASMEVDQLALEEAIQEFGTWRLLSFDRDPRSGSPTIEVAHEALMREWGRFRRWIDSGREHVRLHRRLAAAAREWEAVGREPSYLLRGSNLAQFDALASESTIALTEVEREFVDASRTANELELARQRRQNRRLRSLLAGAVGLLLLAVIAGVFALVSRSNAQHEAQVALGRQLGAEAVSTPRIDLAMLLARESINLDRSTQTEGTLLATLLRTPTVIGTFTMPIQDRPQEVKVSPDARTIAANTNNNRMRLFDTRTHREIRKLPLGNADYSYVPTTGDLFGFGTPTPTPTENAMVLVEPRTGRILRTFGFSELRATSPSTGAGPIIVTPDGRFGFLFWAAARRDGSPGPAYAERWQLDRGGPSKRVRIEGTDMLAATGLSRGRVIVATDERISTWNARTMKEIHSVPTPRAAAGELATFSPDGRFFAYGLGDGTVHFFDTQNGETADGVGGHAASVSQLAFSPDSRVAESGGDDGLSILWNPSTGQALARLGGHGSARVTGADFSPDGKTLYTASLDGTVFAWGLAKQQRFGKPFTTGRPPVLGEDEFIGSPPLAISPDGTRYAVRQSASSVGIYSTTTKPVAKLRLAEAVAAVAWSSQGDLAVVGGNGLVQLWDVRGSPRIVRKFVGLRSTNRQGETVSDVAFSPDGNLLAAGDVNHTPFTVNYRFGTTAVWDVRSGRLIWKDRSKKGWITSVAFSPDGELVTAGREDGYALVYDARTGRLEHHFKLEGGNPFTPTTVAFDPDGTLATGTWAGIVQRWDPRSGVQIGHATLVAAAPVSSISFDRTGAIFATAGGSDGLVKLWETKTQQQFGATFPGGPGQWGNAQFTPNGSKLVVVYGDGTGFVWPVSVKAWERHACAVAGRNFTREEWSRFVGGGDPARVCR